MSFIDSKCFHFYPSENPVNGGSLHWIQPQCVDAYNKLPSMVGSQPIICFLILDCNKYSQVGSLLAHCFFCDLELEENYFYSTVRLHKTNIFLQISQISMKSKEASSSRDAAQTASKKTQMASLKDVSASIKRF